jgi:hypothetical protein
VRREQRCRDYGRRRLLRAAAPRNVNPEPIRSAAASTGHRASTPVLASASPDGAELAAGADAVAVVACTAGATVDAGATAGAAVAEGGTVVAPDVADGAAVVEAVGLGVVVEVVVLVGVGAAVTTMVPCMKLCTRQWYVNVPAVLRVTEND